MVQAFLKKWWVESDFKASNLPLSLRLKGSDSRWKGGNMIYLYNCYLLGFAAYCILRTRSVVPPSTSHYLQCTWCSSREKCIWFVQNNKHTFSEKQNICICPAAPSGLLSLLFHSISIKNDMDVYEHEILSNNNP